MIPHYRPPYGPVTVLGSLLSPWPAPSPAALEHDYAEAMKVPEAVIVPAVRSGILMVIQATLPGDGLVVGPAYTCLVVHEAMLASRRRVRFVEPAEGSYSMSAKALRAAAEPGCCLILSELYGIGYTEQFLHEIEALSPAVRILDAAMGLPSPARLRTLRSNEVALFSFGMGKSLCAGGGGIAFFADRGLAARVRAQRDALVAPLGVMEAWKSDLRLLAGMLLRTRLIAGRADKLRDAFNPARRPARPTLAAKPREVSHISAEWTHKMTAAQRRIAAANLKRIDRSAALRLRQAKRYAEIFQNAGLTCGFAASEMPQSHYPVRVPANRREGLRQRLRKRGLETGDEFPISGLLRSAEHPLTARASSETLTLPLGEGVSMREIIWIAESLVEELRALGAPCCLA